MSYKELIKQEIERIIEEETPISKGSDYYHGAKESMEKLLQFINSLPEESGCEVNCTTKNEDLEEAARKWEDKVYLENGWQDECGTPHASFSEIGNAFIAGAEWQKQQMMKNAVNTIFIQDYSYKTPILYGNIKDKMNIVSGQTIKFCQIKEEQ